MLQSRRVAAHAEQPWTRALSAHRPWFHQHRPHRLLQHRLATKLHRRKLSETIVNSLIHDEFATKNLDNRAGISIEFQLGFFVLKYWPEIISSLNGTAQAKGPALCEF